MTDPVKEAMLRAQAAAAAAPQTSQAPATIPTQEIAAVGPASTPVALSMESMSQGSMSVDNWFKVKEDGLKIGDMAGLLESVEAVIDMTAGRGFILKYGVKNGNPAQYAYTVDLANANGGGTWAAAQARIQALNPSTPAAPYRCVDLPFRLTQDVTKVTGAGKAAVTTVIAKAGDMIGYTTSTTNWKNWETFYKDVDKAGLMGQEVRVKLTAQARTNKAGNNWGVLAIELLGAFEEEGAPD
jgi:hypothetical protein